MTNQIPMDLTQEPSLEEEDYVVSTANRMAFEKLRDWRGGAEDHALVLVGPKASGKSHLVKNWALDLGAFWVSPDYRLDQMRDGKYYLIEDIDQVRYAPVNIFHIFNWAKEKDGAVLFTARTPPQNWAFKLPDLESRVRSVPVIEIDQPDDMLLQLLIAKLFSDQQLSVDGSVIQYAVSRMDRSFEAAYRLVGLADEKALAEKRAITLPVIRACLEEMTGSKSDSD